MQAILAAVLTLFSAALFAENPTLTLTHLRGNVYVVEDNYPLSDENSAVYIGDKFVTVIGATWTPETARLLTNEVAKITRKPIKEVIDTNYNLDRAGGNAYFKVVACPAIATREFLRPSLVPLRRTLVRMRECQNRRLSEWGTADLQADR